MIVHEWHLSEGLAVNESRGLDAQRVYIDEARLWRTLMEMAEIGPGSAGGSNRQALTDADKAGRDLFVHWAREAGCEVSIDAVGNIFARREGSQPDAAPVLTGSHLDTQPTGGRFDGVYGVLAGLEVVRSLNDHRIATVHPVEVAVWTNEEGCRFSPAMLGSGVVAGTYSQEFAESRVDRDGKVFADELARIGYRGSRPAARCQFAAAFEAHIEQGPILERSGVQIGVVTGIQGAYWLELSLQGIPCHAGSTPMEMRKDPWPCATAIIDGAYAIVAAHKPWARVTIGDFRILPGSRNTSPAELIVSMDLRHPDVQQLESLVESVYELTADVCKEFGIDFRIAPTWHMPPTRFDEQLVSLIEQVASACGYSNQRMLSGAGHDSLNIAQIAPTAMIFVPCAGGLSHNEAEYAKPSDLAAGADVLFKAIVRSASP
jgi:beta-ureidopropionase / N-carbamoyl-L-amino-acid hydrolase